MSVTEYLPSILAQNRAEEFGPDVWEDFVIPPFYERLDLHVIRKPRVIIGGRGCGKTMLLRYLSHQSTFSSKRNSVPEGALSHIGLYWKVDTQFASLMTKRDIPQDIWVSAFSHMAALHLGIEVLLSLHSIAKSSFPALSAEDLLKLDFSRLRAFDAKLPSSEEDLQLELEDRIWQFESYVSNVRKRQTPDFLPGKLFVLRLIQLIRKQLPVMEEANYVVYVDEFENLLAYQKKVINSWMKHSEMPLIFNLAMKRRAFKTRKTSGEESVMDIDDFRKHDLEEYYMEGDDFPVFSAEIFFLRLARYGVVNLPIDPMDLRDLSKLSDRREGKYRKKVLTSIGSLFPDISHAELAQAVFEDSVLSNKLRDQITQALKRRGRYPQLSVDLFFRKDLPQASIITPALLHRGGLSPEEIAGELDKLASGEANRFKGSADWIHNNFVGSLLQTYEPLPRACPFYSGFQTYCKLSHGNIRHLLELFYKSIGRALLNGIIDDVSLENPIPSTQQAEAARQASTAFLGEIRNSGPRGNQLHTFVLRLGTLFKLAHQRPTQSESEQSHFTIIRGKAMLSEDDIDFLNEAIKWSVLFPQKGTKKKKEYEPESIEYVLNPIYAPYFHISYNKKKRLELKTDHVITLMRGRIENVTGLLRQYAITWKVEPDTVAPSLFSQTEAEEGQ